MLSARSSSESIPHTLHFRWYNTSGSKQPSLSLDDSLTRLPHMAHQRCFQHKVLCTALTTSWQVLCSDVFTPSARPRGSVNPTFFLITLDHPRWPVRPIWLSGAISSLHDVAWFSQTTGALSRRKTSYLFLDNPDPADYKYGPADPSVSLSIHQFLFHHSSHSTFDSHNSHTFNFHFLKYYIISSYLFILLDPTNIVLRLSFFFFLAFIHFYLDTVSALSSWFWSLLPSWLSHLWPPVTLESHPMDSLTV